MVMVLKMMPLYHLMVIILHKKELHLIVVGEQAIIHLTMVLWVTRSIYDCALSVQASNMFFVIDDGKRLNPLQLGVAFLYPLKTSENLKVF